MNQNLSSKNCAARLIDKLRRVRGRVTTVESCTGGLLASALTDVSGASDVFWGGVVTYQDSAKSVLTRVPSREVARAGAVSESVARGMALGGIKLLRQAKSPRAKLMMSIGITGLAGPRGDGRGLPVGTAFIGIAIARGEGRPQAQVFRVNPPTGGISSGPRSRSAHKRRFAHHALRRALAALAFLGSVACSMGSGNRYEHRLHRIALDTAHFRRPVGESAEDSVYPDEEGYRSQTPPSRQLDCQDLSGFFRGIDQAKLSACLKGIKTVSKAEYRLQRDIQPSLVLSNDDAPVCLKVILPTIPVPREVVFQNNEEDENPLSCFSARLDLSVGKAFGLQIPFDHTYVVLDLPLSVPDSATPGPRLTNLLASWVLTPFLQGSSDEILSKVVPSTVCRACFGKMGLLKPEDRPVYWPSTDGNP